MTKPPPELLEFLHRYDPPIQSLALGLRNVVLEEMAPCHEYIFEMRSKVVLVYGATEKVIKDSICMVNAFARHAILVFTRGTDLNDPAGVLEGSGRTMRHMKLRSLAELDRPEIRAYLREARQLAGLGRRRSASDDVVTRVKSASPGRAVRRITAAAGSAHWPSPPDRDR